MTTREERLQTLLSQIDTHPLVAEVAINGIRPFLEMAEIGRYDLWRGGAAQIGIVNRVIAAMTGNTPTAVHLISLSDPPMPEKPAWASRQAHKASFAFLLDHSYKNGLEMQLLGDSVQLYVDMGQEKNHALKFGLDDILFKDLLPAVRDRLEGLCQGCPIESHYFWRGLKDLLFQYLGWCVIGNAEKIQRLAPMVRLHTRAFFLGEKSDEPGAWLVLTA